MTNPSTVSSCRNIVIVAAGVSAAVAGILFVWAFLTIGNAEFHTAASMVYVVSGGELDLQKGFMVIEIAGAVVAVCSLIGVITALMTKPCGLCFYVLIACVEGVAFGGAAIAIGISFAAIRPELVKEVNRACVKPEETKNLLTCVAAIVAPAIPQQQVTQKQVASSLSRRLDDFTRYNNVTSFGSRQLLKNLADEAAGKSEANFVTRVCDHMQQTSGQATGVDDCQNPCTLLDLLCEKPPEFNELTACVCDVQGPRLSSDGVFNQALCPNTMFKDGICQGTFCSTPDGRIAEGFKEEGCWVRPGALCNGVHAGKPYPIKGPADVPSAFYATGPCSYAVDSRSRLVVQSEEWAQEAVQLVGLLAGLVLFSAVAAGVLFCEVHTGQKVEGHARAIVFGDEDSESEFMGNGSDHDHVMYSPVVPSHSTVIVTQGMPH